MFQVAEIKDSSVKKWDLKNASGQPSYHCPRSLASQILVSNYAKEARPAFLSGVSNKRNSCQIFSQPNRPKEWKPSSN